MRIYILLIILLAVVVSAQEEYNLGKFNIKGKDLSFFTEEYYYPGELKLEEDLAFTRVVFKDKIKVNWQEDNVEKQIVIENVKGSISNNGIITGRSIKETVIGSTIIKGNTLFTYDLAKDVLTVKEGKIDYKNAELFVEEGLLFIEKDKIFAEGKFSYKGMSFSFPEKILISIGKIPEEDKYLAIKYKNQYNFEIICKGECNTVIGATSFNAKKIESCIEETYEPEYRCIESELLIPHIIFKRVGSKDTQVLDTLTVNDGFLEINKGGIKVSTKFGSSLYVDPNSLRNKFPTNTNFLIKNKGVLTITDLGDLIKENINLGSEAIIFHKEYLSDKVTNLASYIVPLNFLENIKLLQTWDSPIPKEGDANYQEYLNMLKHNNKIMSKLFKEGGIEVGTEGALIFVGVKLINPLLKGPIGVYAGETAIQAVEKFANTMNSIAEKLAPYMLRTIGNGLALIKKNVNPIAARELEAIAKSVGGLGEGEFILNRRSVEYLNKGGIRGFYRIESLPLSYSPEETFVALVYHGTDTKTARRIVKRIQSGKPMIVSRIDSGFDVPRNIIHERGHHTFEILRKERDPIIRKFDKIAKELVEDPSSVVDDKEIIFQVKTLRGVYEEDEVAEEVIVNLARRKWYSEEKALGKVDPGLYIPPKDKFFREVVDKVYEGTFRPLPTALIGAKSLAELHEKIEKVEIEHQS